jgi:uncharacterized protein YbaP (TraB family)
MKIRSFLQRHASVQRVATALHWLGALLYIVLYLFAPGPAAAEDAMPYGQGLLWKIEAPHRAPSYVFGTMHISDKRVTTLPKPVRDALNEVDDLNLELDFGSGWGDYESRMLQLPKKKQLSGILGDKLFAEVKHRLGAQAAKNKNLERLKPWVVLLSLAKRPLRPGETGTENRLPLDLELHALALKRGIPVFGIETFEEQLNVFDKLSEADQVDMIRTTIATPEHEAHQQLEKMIQLYVARDLAGLITLTQEAQGRGGAAYLADFDKRLITDRNRVMARRLEDVLVDGGAFVAVGAAHLPGEKGLLSLLAKRGYKVERVY